MLWNLIFDFYVKYIFGGFDSTGQYYIANISGVIRQTNPVSEGTGTLLSGYSITSIYGENLGLSLGNYLSLIATIITLVVILLVIGHFIKKAFNLFGRII